MYRPNQDRLTPIISPVKNYEERRPQEPFLTGALCVNKLFCKPKDPFDAQVDQFSTEPKSKKKYSSYKQEHHIRLNRESKLKVNEEIVNYLSGAKHKQRSKSPRKPIITRVKHVKNEIEQVRDASKQIAEINKILQNRTAEKKEKQTRMNSLESSFNEGMQKTRTNMASNINHTCAKTLRNRMHNYNSIIEDFEKNLKWDEQKKNRSKFYFSTPAKDPTIKYKTNRTDIQNTLDALNIRLTKSKDKFLIDSVKPDKVTRDFTPKRPPPKYKSIKDLKIDENKLRQFEEEVKKRCKLAEDAKETKVLYENEIFKKKPLLTDHYSEANLIKNYKPTNLLKTFTPDTKSPKIQPSNTRDATTTPRKTPRTPKKTPRFSPIQEERTLTPKLDAKSPRKPPRKVLVPETKLTDKNSKTIGISTSFGPQDDLQKSIMKSEFLMKEFAVNQEGVLGKNKKNKKVVKEPEIVNWADKFKVKHVRKLPKELDYIMS